MIARRLEADHPDDNRGRRVLPMPLVESFVGEVRPTVLMLLVAVALVLLVACANVANLFLAHGLGRQKELAIRAALGASRARLVRQSLTESVLLALAAGATGLLLAHWLLKGLLALAPETLPRAAEIGLSVPATACALALSVLTPLLFGLFPSLLASKAGLNEALGAGGRSGRGAVRPHARRALIVSEMALAAILLVGAGLFARTFTRLVQGIPALSPRTPSPRASRCRPRATPGMTTATGSTGSWSIACRRRRACAPRACRPACPSATTT